MGMILDAEGRPADGTPPDPYAFSQIQSEVSDKGFLVTTTEDLFHWARTGSLWWMTLRPRLLRGRDDPCEHAALRP